MVTDAIKAAIWEELRFVKRQQWTITAAVVALIGGAYTLAGREDRLDDLEKSVAAILITVVVIGAIYWLRDLQRYLHRTRLVTDPDDRKAEHRGLEIAYGMRGAMILSAVVVCYLLLRDGAWKMLRAICLAFATLPMGF
jgi:ABC-type branched-subunit amino acid transport system permease subunit